MPRMDCLMLPPPPATVEHATRPRRLVAGMDRMGTATETARNRAPYLLEEARLRRWLERGSRRSRG